MHYIYFFQKSLYVNVKDDQSAQPLDQTKQTNVRRSIWMSPHEWH